MLMKLLTKEEGYNACPRCGRFPYEFMDEYDTYEVGCAYCGITNGVTSFLEEPLNEAIREKTKKDWNEKCLKTPYSEDVFDASDIDVGDFVLVRRASGAIAHIVADIAGIVEILRTNGEVFDMYVRMDDILQPLDTADLLEWALGPM